MVSFARCGEKIVAVGFMDELKWTPQNHHKFPLEVREQIKAIWMLWEHKGSALSRITMDSVCTLCQVVAESRDFIVFPEAVRSLAFDDDY